jgi:hypothetical protein
MTRPTYLSRCLCGLRAALHFTHPHMTGRKLTCGEARARHPYAVAKCLPFISVLKRAS